jgi:hypothetical protein
VKKQKESAAQFKSFMDQKNKELIEARKLRIKEKREHSKLEVENRKLNDMMGRKVKAHQKTEQALQRNKQHLVKLLAERKREQQRQRSNKISNNNKKKNGSGGNGGGKSPRGGGSNGGSDKRDSTSSCPSDDVLTWAPEDQRIRSSKFFILEMLNMRVAKREREEKEERLQSEYDSLQRMVFEEVETLNQLKETVLTLNEHSLNQENSNGVDLDGHYSEDNSEAVVCEGDIMSANNELIEQEERLEALILKMSLVGEALSEIHLPAFEEEEEAANNMDDELREIDMVAQLEAPMLRTVLWSLLDGYTDVIYEKDRLEQLLRLKTAEASAAEERCSAIEQDNSRLKKGFHERVTLLQHERTELVEAIFSPSKKKGMNNMNNNNNEGSNIMNSSSSSALMSMNSELEEKLRAEMELRVEFENKFKEAEAKALVLSEKLKLAEMMTSSSSDDDNSNNNTHARIGEVVQDIQQVWTSIELEEVKRSELLDRIVNANMNCALATLEDSKEQESTMVRETEDLTNYLKKLEKVLFQSRVIYIYTHLKCYCAFLVVSLIFVVTFFFS